MGWYLVKRTVKGNVYLYRQRSWRENGKVRTQSRYIGPYRGSWQEAKDQQRKERAKAERRKAAKTSKGIQSKNDPPVITTARLTRLQRWTLWLRARREFGSLREMVREYRNLKARGQPEQDWKYWDKQMSHHLTIAGRYDDEHPRARAAFGKWDGCFQKRCQIGALLPLLKSE